MSEGLKLNNFTEQLCKNDFKYFVKLVLGLKTNRMHEEMINAIVNSGKHVVAIAPRGHGKTIITSVSFPLWAVWRSEKPITILVMSATLDQSTEILEQIKTFVSTVDVLRRDLYPDNIHDTQWSATKLKFRNGSRIMCSPFGSSVRGKHVNYAILDDILKDESANIEYAKETFYSAVFPIVNAKNGKILMVGTPMSYTDLLNDLMKPDKANDWVQLRYRAVEEDENGNLVNPLFPELFSLEKLEKIKRTQPPHLWAKEYLCDPMSGDLSLFPYKLIKQCKELEFEDDEDDVGRYFLGCDIALSDKAGADYSVFVVALRKKDHVEIVDMWRRKGVSTEEQIKEIERLHKHYKFSKILIEKVGLSIGMVDEMLKNPNLMSVTVPFVTKRANKEEILSHLEVMMRNRGLKFHDFPGFNIMERELLSFKYRVKNDKQTYESVGEHDDTVIALALAVEAATSSLGVPSIAFVGGPSSVADLLNAKEKEDDEVRYDFIA